MTKTLETDLSPISEQPIRFWIFIGGLALLFLLTNFGQPNPVPPVILHITLSAAVSWSFGIRQGVIVAFLLVLLRLLALDAVLAFLPPNLPNGRLAIMLTMFTPFIVVVASGWAGTRLREVRQLSYDLLFERERLQEEIAQRKTLEQQLRQAVIIAQEASKTKSIFLANMSHELRTPLAAIIGYNELLREQLDESLGLTRYLDKSLLSASHLQAIISDILDLSRIEAGSVAIEAKAFSLTDCLTAVFNIIAIQSNDKNLYLRYHIHPHTPDQLIGDIVHLQQVLINLLDNGVKFTETGGITLTIIAEVTTPPQYQYQFSIQDTGQGIAATNQDHIFETYNQANRAGAKQKEGAGLGLAISKYLVEAMGGHIWVESQLEQGTTFHFSIQANVVNDSPFVYTEGIVQYQPHHPLLLMHHAPTMSG